MSNSTADDIAPTSTLSDGPPLDAAQRLGLARFRLGPDAPPWLTETLAFARDEFARLTRERDEARADAAESQRRLDAECSAMDARDGAYRALRGAPDGTDDLVALAEWRMRKRDDARAALREYAPRCPDCDAVATRRSDGDAYDHRSRLHCDACAPTDASADVLHAAAVRAAQVTT